MSKKTYKKRATTLLLTFMIIFLALLWRIKFITVDNSGELSVMQENQFEEVAVLSDLKYMIFDQNGKQMLNYKNKYKVVIDPSTFARNYDNEDELFALTYILRDYKSEYNLLDIGLDKSSAKKIFDVDESTYKKLSNIKNVKGFYTYKFLEVDRTDAAWKVENMLSSIKDTASGKTKNENSIEMSVYKKTEQNEFPKQKFNKDLEGNISVEQFIPPEKNVNVRLTIDKNIQDRIKEILTSEKYDKHNQIGVALMESSTGKILSMTQKDDSQPNVNLGSTGEGFDPGSIFKVIVEEAGLERNKISLGTKYACKQGIYTGAYDLCPEKDHGLLSAEEAIIVSCNNIFAQIGDKVGVSYFIDNAVSQGLFDKALNFDSETRGKYRLPGNGEGAGNLAIGQSMNITPIQAISIANTVVNGGYYVKPYIIDAFVDNDAKGLEVLTTDKHQSISKSTANILKNQMIKVVNNGTGRSAQIPNIEVGGKTGTSQRSDGGIETSDGWFVGFFKINNKYYSMVVFVKDIDKEKEQAATTAAPLFRDIVLAVNSYLQK
jgi:cell division protein FtsI/penicillin-binding protein 2